MNFMESWIPNIGGGNIGRNGGNVQFIPLLSDKEIMSGHHTPDRRSEILRVFISSKPSTHVSMSSKERMRNTNLF